MLRLKLETAEAGPHKVLCLGAHADDIEIGCGATLLQLAAAQRIELTLHNESPGEISGDPIRLAQMMDNLVSNAIKFTPDGGRVTVTTSAVDGHIVLEVADSGPGITPADQAQLFDRFFRTRDAAVRATTGTGLGLTITKAIVEAHDGTIGVVSAVGVGTTFRVELPHSDATVG